MRKILSRLDGQHRDERSGATIAGSGDALLTNAHPCSFSTTFEFLDGVPFDQSVLREIGRGLRDHLRRVIVCALVYSRRPSVPPSTPMPDCFIPPNAASGVRCWVSLTQTVPLAMRWATA